MGFPCYMSNCHRTVPCNPCVWFLSFFLSILFAPLLEHRADFSVPTIIFTDGRTPWTGDQLFSRPLSKRRTTQTQNKHIHTPNIHALCGIRTDVPSFRASEKSTCLKTAWLPWPPFDYHSITIVNWSLLHEINFWVAFPYYRSNYHRVKNCSLPSCLCRR
jgi:hypothetical protein